MRQDDPRDSHDPPARPHGPAPRVAVHFPHVRAAVAERCGSPVVAAASQDAGFTPGFASVHLRGRQPPLREGRVGEGAADGCRRLPRGGPQARRAPRRSPRPRLLWTCEDDWVVLGLGTSSPGQPRRPWRVEDLDACPDMLTAMAEALTPALQELRLDDVATELEWLPPAWDHMRSTYPDLAHRQEAAVLAARFAEVTAGTTVVHTDVHDNVLLTDDGRVLLCDWNWPARRRLARHGVPADRAPRRRARRRRRARPEPPHRRGAGRARRHRAGAGGGLLLPPCRPAGAVLLTLGARGPALAGRGCLEIDAERRGCGPSVAEHVP